MGHMSLTSDALRALVSPVALWSLIHAAFAHLCIWLRCGHWAAATQAPPPPPHRLSVSAQAQAHRDNMHFSRSGQSRTCAGDSCPDLRWSAASGYAYRDARLKFRASSSTQARRQKSRRIYRGTRAVVELGRLFRQIGRLTDPNAFVRPIFGRLCFCGGQCWAQPLNRHIGEPATRSSHQSASGELACMTRWEIRVHHRAFRCRSLLLLWIFKVVVWVFGEWRE